MKLAKAKQRGMLAQSLLTQLRPYMDELKDIIKETMWQAVDDDYMIKAKNTQRGFEAFEALLVTLISDGQVAQKDQDRLSGRVTTIN